MTPLELVDGWRARARLFIEHEHTSTAIAYQRCAGELEAFLRADAEQPLTLKQAAKLGGYSEDHLGRMLREDKLPNAGRRGAPRIRRTDVPVKPTYVASASSDADVDLTQIVRSVIDEGV